MSVLIILTLALTFCLPGSAAYPEDWHAGALATTPSSAQAPTREQSGQKEESLEVFLMYLWTAREADDKCHALSLEERKRLNLQLAAMLKALKTTEEEQKSHMEAFNAKCDDDTTQLLFAWARGKSVQTSLGPEKAREQADRALWAFGNEGWKRKLKDLPAGRLSAFEGCWRGALNSMPIEMCINDKGNAVQFRLGNRASPYCSFDQVSARMDGGLVIFSTPASGKCADGSVGQYAQVECRPLSDIEMKCDIQVYSKGITLYQTREGKTMSGNVKLLHAKP